jgi:hypothetical protein
MQFVNDDMDDIFRRAAEDYPLKTDNSDWDKLVSKMRADTGDKNNPGKKDNRRRYLLLLALIPVLLICTTYIKNNNSRDTAVLINKETTSEQTTPGVDEKTTTKATVDNELKGSDIVELSQEKIKNIQDAVQQDAIKNKETKQFKGYNSNGDDKNFSQGKQNHKPRISSEKAINVTDEQNNTLAKTNAGNSQINTAPLSPDHQITNDQNAITGKENKQTENKDSEEMAVTTTAAKEKQLKKKEPKLYFGLQAGPDFSMVKSTHVRGTGYSFGLLAGYKFGKKFGVETGLLWDRKSYQSDGQYFNTEKLNWPHVTIIDLTGYCNMFEIPLNLRYDFSANSKRTWFANAGLSSYLMKKESYDYDYQRYGLYQKGHKEYQNTTTNWLSVAHLSIGLQKNLGAIGDLRIEPYVKLPVNGVGIGSMPLRSTGIYLGITRPIR